MEQLTTSNVGPLRSDLLALRIEPELKQQLKFLADSEDRTLSRFVERALKDAVARAKDAPCR
jgi:predicted transcriptional regulator